MDIRGLDGQALPTLKQCQAFISDAAAMCDSLPFALGLSINDLSLVDHHDAHLPTAKAVAAFVYNQCVALVGTNTAAPAEAEQLKIRIRVKLSANDKDAPQGTAVVLAIPSTDLLLWWD